MLDAYRQMEMLAHILGVPHEALGLKDADGKPVILSLDSQLPGALGMFSLDESGTRTISLPGRSNSFAHEWGHALDQWLSRFLIDSEETSFMLSRDVMADGVDPKATRSEAIAQAFVGVMQALFGDKAKLAAMKLDLQQQSEIKTKAGKESAKARRAKAMLKDIDAGKKLPKAVWSKYFQTSLEYDKMMRSRYFQDPAEMLARAMETYAGVRASQISDLPTSFLSKPNWAYTGSEDTRASMTFPRGADADNIFTAFDRLGDALRDEAVFGSKGRANKPEDVDVFDMRKWDKWKPKGSLLEIEKQVFRAVDHDGGVGVCHGVVEVDRSTVAGNGIGFGGNIIRATASIEGGVDHQAHGIDRIQHGIVPGLGICNLNGYQRSPSAGAADGRSVFTGDSGCIRRQRRAG